MELASHETCTGCTACYSACSFEAIEMRSDRSGFLHPSISHDKCKSCGACSKACPIINKIRVDDSFAPVYLVAQNKNEAVRRESTSGGIFTALAESIISKGGCVCGAALIENRVVKHIIVDHIEDLGRIRGSKYVQSEMGDTYSIVNNRLKGGQVVLFSGTPCQVSGLLSFLNYKYDNLLTLDLMCRAVPSPAVYKKYVEYMQTRYPNFNKLVFRDKTLGYSYSTLVLYDFSNKKTLYRAGVEADPYLRLFFNGYCNRESCSDCHFQSGRRSSDITLWDCFRIYRLAPELNDNIGTTNTILWTKKGRSVFESLGEKLLIKQLVYSDELKPLLRENPLPAQIDSKQFYEDLKSLNPDQFFGKYSPISLKVKVKATGRRMLIKLHLHDSVRKLVHIMKGKNK